MDKLKEIYLTDTGRFNRLKYFKYLMLITIVEIIIDSIIEVIFADKYGVITPTGDTFANIIFLAFSIPNYFITVKRLQDFGQDSFWAKVNVACSLYLLFVLNIENPSLFDGTVCIAKCILILFILFKPGDVGENQYGPDPLQ